MQPAGLVGGRGGLAEGAGGAGEQADVQPLQLRRGRGARWWPGRRGWWRGSRRSGPGAGRASRAGRGRGCGPRAGDRPGAGPGPVSCPASRVRPPAAACSPARCPRWTGADRWCAAGTSRPASRRRRPSRRPGAAARGGGAQEPVPGPGWVEITPRSSARLVGLTAGRSRRSSPPAGRRAVRADGGVAVGGVGVVADHEPLVLGRP